MSRMLMTVVSIVLTMFLFGCATTASPHVRSEMVPMPTSEVIPPEEDCYRGKSSDQWCMQVTGVSDGNLLKGIIHQPGQAEYEGRIELLGVGETTDQAKVVLEKQLVGKTVWLNFDSNMTSSENFAIPAYVFDHENEINMELIEQGYAKVTNDFTQLDHEVGMREAEHMAKMQKLGGWGDGTWK